VRSQKSKAAYQLTAVTAGGLCVFSSVLLQLLSFSWFFSIALFVVGLSFANMYIQAPWPMCQKDLLGEIKRLEELFTVDKKKTEGYH